MAERAAVLTPEQQQVLQAIYDRFREDATWPAFASIDRQLRRGGMADPLAAMDTIPAELLLSYRPGRAQPASTDQLRLSLQGIAVCRGSDDDVDHFLRVLPWLAQKELDFEPPADNPDAQPQFSSSEVRTFLGLGDDAVGTLARLYQIMLLERWGRGSGGGDPRGDWHFEILREVAQFAAINTLDDYLTVKAQIEEAARRAYVASVLPALGSTLKLAGAFRLPQFVEVPAGAGTDGADIQLQLNEREWVLGESIGGGGFGHVFEAWSGGIEAVVKLVPKLPGAERELLFAELVGVRNVIPVIDRGESGDSWALVMPRADKSLRQHLEETAGPLSEDDAITVFADVATALEDLERDGVVHRDIKPENVLFYGGHWCLADFGISRYAEATTAPDTRKFALTPAYTAPERWRNERAMIAADVYSLGVMAYELLSGTLPFNGPRVEDFREQHLHAPPEPLDGVSVGLGALVDECLFKAAEARPNSRNILARLASAATPPPSSGLARLQQAYQADVAHRGESVRQQSRLQTEVERRKGLVDAARRGMSRVAETLKTAIVQVAPSASIVPDRHGGWAIRLNQAELRYTPVVETALAPWGVRTPPVFTVIAHAELSVEVPPGRDGYEGRSHSLWYGDVQEADQYQWFETAFMISPLIPRESRRDPFALPPSEDAAKAVGPGIAGLQLAWPFTLVHLGEMDEFIGRWAGWLADASQGQLRRPSTMPERHAQGSWRQS